MRTGTIMDFWSSFQEFADPENFHQFWHAAPAPPAPAAPAAPAAPVNSDAQDRELQLAQDFEDFLATLESDFITPPQETTREEIPSPSSPPDPLEPSTVDEFMQLFDKSLEVLRVAFQKTKNFQPSPKKRKRTPNAIKLFPAEKRVIRERCKKTRKSNIPVPPSHHPFPHRAPANLTPDLGWEKKAQVCELPVAPLMTDSTPIQAPNGFEPHYLAPNYQAPTRGHLMGTCTINSATVRAIPLEEYLNLGPQYKGFVQQILNQPVP